MANNGQQWYNMTVLKWCNLDLSIFPIGIWPLTHVFDEASCVKFSYPTVARSHFVPSCQLPKISSRISVSEKTSEVPTLMLEEAS